MAVPFHSGQPDTTTHPSANVASLVDLDGPIFGVRDHEAPNNAPMDSAADDMTNGDPNSDHLCRDEDTQDDPDQNN